jgi:transcriptional regulator with XRE-family HTH domain
MRRALLDITQEKLGSALGVSFQQIQKYEKGTNRIGASRMNEIARVLKVDVNFFYEGLPQDEAPGGFAEEAAAPFTPDVNMTAEGVRLHQAFSRIKDPKVRKQIVALVVSLASPAGKEEVGGVLPKTPTEVGDSP